MAVKPFTFSDGTCIPQGDIVVGFTTPVHRNPDIYPNPDRFLGFRFADLREQSKQEEVKNQMVATSLRDFLGFSHGKHGWYVLRSILIPPVSLTMRSVSPGRFFAANELKVLLGMLILDYDLRWADPSVPPGWMPKPLRLGMHCVPNPKAEILIRRRGEKCELDH